MSINFKTNKHVATGTVIHCKYCISKELPSIASCLATIKLNQLCKRQHANALQIHRKLKESIKH